MDSQRSVSVDCTPPRKLRRSSAGQLAGMWASRLVHSFSVRVGILRHRASSFTRDVWQSRFTSAKQRRGLLLKPHMASSIKPERI